MNSDAARALAARMDAALARPAMMDSELHARFVSAQRELGLVHGTRPLCKHLRPLILPANTYRDIGRAAELVSAALERVAARALEDEALGRRLGLSSNERALAAHDPGYPELVTVGRLDGLMNADGYFFIELNADSPAGIADQLLIDRTLLRLPHVASAMAEVECFTPRPEHALLDALCRSYRAWGGKCDFPSIAIVDWASADTSGEFRALAEEFTRAGHETLCVDPDELSIERGALFARGRRIDLVYRRVIMQELLERRGTHHTLFRAYRERVACIANSLRTKVINKKAAFAILSDPEYAHLFSDDQNHALLTHIPWTRLVESKLVTWRGARLPMQELLLAQRENFVLKPNDDFGGKGVLLGWQTDPERWSAAVHTATSGQEVMIAQERKPAGRLELPVYTDKLEREQVYFDVCPFIFAGRSEGAMVRLSSSALSNVSAGGGVSALLVIDDGESGFAEQGRSQRGSKAHV